MTVCSSFLGNFITEDVFMIISLSLSLSLFRPILSVSLVLELNGAFHQLL